MAKLAFRKLATPSCVKLFTCRPLSLGGGANPFSFGSQCSKAENSMISLSAAPSCANSSTLSSAFLNTNSPSTLCWPLSLKPFDSQDRIYQSGCITQHKTEVHTNWPTISLKIQLLRDP